MSATNRVNRSIFINASIWNAHCLNAIACNEQKKNLVCFIVGSMQCIGTMPTGWILVKSSLSICKLHVSICDGIFQWVAIECMWQKKRETSCDNAKMRVLKIARSLVLVLNSLLRYVIYDSSILAHSHHSQCELSCENLFCRTLVLSLLFTNNRGCLSWWAKFDTL